jgi:hypothetical protein
MLNSVMYHHVLGDEGADLLAGPAFSLEWSDERKSAEWREYVDKISNGADRARRVNLNKTLLTVSLNQRRPGQPRQNQQSRRQRHHWRGRRSAG